MRVIDWHDEADRADYWDPAFNGAPGNTIGFLHEELCSDPHTVIQRISECTAYHPPALEEIEKLGVGDFYKKELYNDHEDGCWGSIPEGYLVFRVP
ncbi:hypothetical protein A3K34_02385 [candidate division WWE3 bacterium RIFOXYC1_FULL_40_10]|nr:MAG: hypothetical protein A3K58_02385 [candidate division WWE3 bacterium RIFOXYB1_FULL_40_22]OGC61699.1 MAG: hypothetical protein A3K37_02385 [candidate division WWE3 bacterium RIFOXYA1_FULL_40_11]OGC66082.1 MAG: hypothetical protein A3K34_02385 [candidate division WWE3 bacterium RIFOXYC1_FULL_40_10]